MNYYEVSPATIINAHSSVLTYSSRIALQTGQIVSVEIGRRLAIAVVVKAVSKPSFETKEIVSVVETAPLPKPLLKLHDWISSYYESHSALVWRTMLPSGINKSRRASSPTRLAITRNQENFELNPHQKTAVKSIMAKKTGTHLLHGVTGSGKTAVYIDVAKKTIDEGRSVIILVPEIALTSQIVADFTPHFKNVHVTHSTMTEASRHSLWNYVGCANEPQVIIGPRSALFMPLKNLGLIVIDECHEPSFKQEQSPRYSAIRAASILSRLAGARLVLGSATPSIVDYYLASQENAVIELPVPARQTVVAPNISLVDMTKPLNFTRSQFLSGSLLQKLTETLAANKQALIFHNRRGSAPITLCENCGWSATCPRCFTPLTLHADAFHLRCHLCNFSEHIPTHCPDCHTTRHNTQRHRH